MDMDINGGFPGGSDGKESACKARDLGSVSGQEEPLMNTSYPLHERDPVFYASSEMDPEMP